jgi:general secretion pathway protein N
MTRAGEKMLTTVLAATCGVLFVLALAMQFGLGRGYHWLDADKDATDSAGNAAIDRDPVLLPPQSNFAATNQRPLFNDDRKPTKEENAGPPDQAPPSPLNISLTGTLLVGKPPARTAMVRENGKVQTIALKEGMPLPGEQGAWTLSQVKNRSAVFKSSGGEEVEVELAVASASQKPNPPPRIGGAAAAATPDRAANPSQAGPVPAQGGDELQRRIEERRKQMREAAERMKAERQNDQQTPQPPQPPQPQQQ